MTLKTFMRWPGNKSKHINKILPYVPDDYNTYIEPFVGSGALFLKLEPKKWIINDLNKDCINAWKSLKNDPEYIIQEFKNFGKKFKPMNNQKKIEYCRTITTNISKMPYNIDRVISYILMKYCAFLGFIFIRNKFYFQSLDLNIYTKNNYPFLSQTTFKNITDVSSFLNEAKGTIYNTDYKKVLTKAKRGDFVFLDPPYVEEHNYSFKYNKNEQLDLKFLKELLVEVKKLDDKDVMWMMTQADTKDVKKLFKGYIIKQFPVYRAQTKNYVNELIIMNYVL